MRATNRTTPGTFAIRVVVTLYGFLFVPVLLKILRVTSPPAAIACISLVALTMVGIGVAVERRSEFWAYSGILEPLFFYVENYLSTLRVKRAVADVQRRALTIRSEVLREVITQIEVSNRFMTDRFPEARKELMERTAALAVTVFEDDSEPSASLVVMDSFRRLGFAVNTVTEQAGFFFYGDEPRMGWRFSGVRTDYLVVGPKVPEDSITQFVREVHPWGEALRILRVNAIANDTTLIAQLFEAPLRDLPPAFTALALSQMWISLKFWQAQGQQRHRFSHGNESQHGGWKGDESLRNSK